LTFGHGDRRTAGLESSAIPANIFAPAQGADIQGSGSEEFQLGCSDAMVLPLIEVHFLGYYDGPGRKFLRNNYQLRASSGTMTV
jgi:hypothetical protein